MGYAGVSYLTQEFCNALFDALFDILPLGAELDNVSSTLARSKEPGSQTATSAPAEASHALPWDDGATEELERQIERLPVLVRISAAKQMRDSAERLAATAGREKVTAVEVRQVIAEKERAA
jgi:chlorophyllide a reductase subunit Z